VTQHSLSLTRRPLFGPRAWLACSLPGCSSLPKIPPTLSLVQVSSRSNCRWRLRAMLSHVRGVFGQPDRAAKTPLDLGTQRSERLARDSAKSGTSDGIDQPASTSIRWTGSPVLASARSSPLQWSTQIDFSPTMLCIWHRSEGRRVGGMFLVLRWSGSIGPVAIWLRWLASFGGWLALVAG
jgi:hypothetical protein